MTLESPLLITPQNISLLLNSKLKKTHHTLKPKLQKLGNI